MAKFFLFLLPLLCLSRVDNYDGYNVVFRLNNFSSVDIYSSTNYDKNSEICSECFVFTIHGERKLGKTLIGNKLLGTNLPSSKDVSTVGLSMSKQELNGQPTWLVDTEGINGVKTNKNVERLLEETSWKLPGEHIQVFGEISSTNEKKVQEIATKTSANRIYVIFNMMHKSGTEDYVDTFASISGRPAPVKKAVCDGNEVSVIFMKNKVKGPFMQREVLITSYVLLNYNSTFGKCINDITIDEIRSTLSKESEPTEYEPVQSFLEALNSSMIHDTNVDVAKFEYNTSYLKPESLNMSSEVVNQKVDEKISLINKYFRSFYDYYMGTDKTNRTRVVEHTRIGRVNITGLTVRDGKEVEEPIVVSSASNLRYSIWENSTTVLIKVSCPGFEPNQTLKVIPVHDNKSGVKLYFIRIEDDMGMTLLFSNMEHIYGKKLFMAEFRAGVGYTYCYDLTIYEKGILNLFWRRDGIQCSRLW